MTSPHLNGRADAERLSAAWDDLVSGRLIETDDEGLVTVASRLHARSTTVRERPGFRQDLRDSLMQSPSMALTDSDVSPSRHAHPHSSELSALPPMTALRKAGGRWISLAATIALLIATAAGGYLATAGLPGDAGRAPSVGGLQDATPSPFPTPAWGAEQFQCGPGNTFDPYLPCSLGQEAIGATELNGTYSTAARAVSKAQMQSWEIAGSQRLTFAPPRTPVVGIGVDFVIDGVYVGTFSTEVTVTDDAGPYARPYASVPAGTPVELESGDIVTYELGTKLGLANPLASSPLLIKSVVFFDGDPSPVNLVESGEYTARVDGDGALPKSIDQYGDRQPGIIINYVYIDEGYPFPPAGSKKSVVLGPVDPLDGPVGTEGFVVWAMDGKG